MDEGDIQIISNEIEEPVSCQICSISLSKESVAGRQAHYEQHFDGSLDPPCAGPSKPRALAINAKYVPRFSFKKSDKEKAAAVEKQNVFWHRSQSTRPPRNFTPGLIPILKKALIKSHEKGTTIRAALCYDGMIHVATEGWDMGWGCGYRNFLMACTALIDQQVQPLYFPALDQPTPPGVRNLQQWIEDAWTAGYDEEGAAELKHKLVGSSKWIGTAELYVAFLYRGIPGRLVDFPNVASSADAVLQWIEHYFTSPLAPGTTPMRVRVKTTIDEALRGASPVIVTDRMPLVLQHEGHSRTIVGFEKTKNGLTNLLCFDPSKRPKGDIREAAIAQYLAAQNSAANAPTTPTRKRHLDISPSKIINNVLHPSHHDDNNASSSIPSRNSRNNKRPSPQEQDPESRDTKRVRGGLRLPRKRDVIVIDNDEEEKEEDDDDVQFVGSSSQGRIACQAQLVEVDFQKVLGFFRLRPAKVGKNARYQILYFPLEDVLSEQERWTRRVVTSEIVR